LVDTSAVYAQVERAHESTHSIKLEKNSEIWKVEWIHVLSLIMTRRVYVQNGYAYITKLNLINLLSQFYRDRLGAVLDRIFKVWPYLEEEESERLVPFLTKFGNKSVGHEYKVNTVVDGSITLENLDGLVQQSFPLCMKHLHDKVKTEHHLKHQGRLQYGLFLKGIGLSLEMAMDFWKNEFTKKMTESDFVKNYSYGFRHQFGIEGKKTNYTPYGCMKIIMGNPPMGEGAHHGCPYKHLEANALRKELKDTFPSIQPVDVEEIMELVGNSHYQVACSKYFDITHSTLKHDPMTVSHPNQYFDASRKLYAIKTEQKTESIDLK
jgi:DNA primase large subunit